MKYSELWDAFRAKQESITVKIFGVSWFVETIGLFDHTRDIAEVRLSFLQDSRVKTELLLSFQDLSDLLNDLPVSTTINEKAIFEKYKNLMVKKYHPLSKDQYFGDLSDQEREWMTTIENWYRRHGREIVIGLKGNVDLVRFRDAENDSHTRYWAEEYDRDPKGVDSPESLKKYRDAMYKVLTQ